MGLVPLTLAWRTPPAWAPVTACVSPGPGEEQVGVPGEGEGAAAGRAGLALPVWQTLSLARHFLKKRKHRSPYLTPTMSCRSPGEGARLGCCPGLRPPQAGQVTAPAVSPGTGPRPQCAHLAVTLRGSPRRALRALCGRTLARGVIMGSGFPGSRSGHCSACHPSHAVP